MRKAFLSSIALGTLLLGAQPSAATTVKPIAKLSKSAMATACANAGGRSYSNDRGGYGCTGKDSSWTMECGSKGKCVQINWTRTQSAGGVGGANAGTNEGARMLPRASSTQGRGGQIMGQPVGGVPSDGRVPLSSQGNPPRVTGVVRDHRRPGGHGNSPSGGVSVGATPIVRDHRTPAAAPIVRDHRETAGPRTSRYGETYGYGVRRPSAGDSSGGVSGNGFRPRPVVRDHRN